MSTLAENKKARFDYEILDTYEAGITLSGQEVKSVRAGRANLVGSFVAIKPDGAFLLNAQIPPYQPKNAPTDYDPARTRKLLLNQQELKFLLGKSKEGGLTVVPLSLYNKGRHIKVAIALARHKKKSDKRDTIKKREFQREKRGALKRG